MNKKYFTPTLTAVLLMTTISCTSQRKQIRQEFARHFEKETQQTAESETKLPLEQELQKKPTPAPEPATQRTKQKTAPPAEFIIPDTLTADIPAEIEKGRKYFKQKNYSASLEQYELFLLKAPPDAPYSDEALLMTGVNYDWIAKKAKDVYFIKKERQTLSKLINQHDQSIHKAEAHFYLGQTYAGFVGVTLHPNEINYSLAVNHFENAYKQSHRKWIKAKSLLRLGQTYEKMGLSLKSKEYYLAVRDIYPESQAAAEALEMLKETNTKEPITGIDLTETGKKLFDGGEYGLALNVFKKAEVKYAGTSKAHYPLMMQGICYLWLGNLEKAENILRKTYSANTQAKGETAFYLAFVLEKRGKITEAMKLYSKAAENPQNYKWVIERSKQRLKLLDKIKK